MNRSIIAMTRLGTLALAAVFAMAAAEHRGQVQFGGLPVPGATVTATQGDKKLVAVTDLKGAYRFPDLADGMWTLKIEMLCFAPIDREVVVAPDAPAAIWELKMLPLAELQAAAGPASAPSAPVSLTVSPPQSAPPPTAPARRGKSRDAKAAQAQPPNPQAGFQRAGLNASADGGKLSEDAPEPNQSAADGLLVSGSVNNGAASPFAQSPAFGNNRKGARSLYNGNIGITMDNAALDARAFSLTGQDTPKLGYNHMQGFAAFGGPLYIPHLMRPSRTPLNFFVGYQWQRNRNASDQSALMPLLAQRMGDFSQALNPLALQVPVLDPATGSPFPGNVIPQSRISPQATALLKLYPLPNFTASARYNYQVPILGTSDQDAVQVNLNKTLSTKNQINGSLGYQRTSADNPSLFGFTDTTGSSGINTQVGFSTPLHYAILRALRIPVQPSGHAHHAVLCQSRKHFGTGGNLREQSGAC